MQQKLPKNLFFKNRPLKFYLNILQWNNSSGLLVSCVFKVVKTVVIQDEPPPLPRLVAATLLHEPTLAVRVEKGVHEIVSIILGNLEWLCFDAFIEALWKKLPLGTTLIDYLLHFQ